MTARNDITGDAIKTRPNTREYEAKREAIFGGKRQTGSWVYDPDKKKLVPKEEFLREKPRPKKAGFFLGAREYQAYESPATGKVISNAKQEQYDLQASGCRIYEGKDSEMKEAHKYRAEQDTKLENSIENTLLETDYQIEHGYIQPTETY